MDHQASTNQIRPLFFTIISLSECKSDRRPSSLPCSLRCRGIPGHQLLKRRLSILTRGVADQIKLQPTPRRQVVKLLALAGTEDLIGNESVIIRK